MYLTSDYGTDSWSGSVSITYDVPAAFSGLTWRGTRDESHALDHQLSVLNWTNGTSSAPYTDGTAVMFDNSVGTGSRTVAISDGDVSPSSVTFSNTGTYTLTGPCGIAGATGLNVAGALLPSASTYTGGLLIVSNTNSYTGITNISVGTLQIGNVARHSPRPRRERRAGGRPRHA